MKAQYKLLPVHHDYKLMETSLNDLAEEGWIFKSVIKRSSQEYIVLEKLFEVEGRIQTKNALIDYNDVRILHQDGGREIEVGLAQQSVFDELAASRKEEKK